MRNAAFLFEPLRVQGSLRPAIQEQGGYANSLPLQQSGIQDVEAATVASFTA
jgi:hypothetical protein